MKILIWRDLCVGFLAIAAVGSGVAAGQAVAPAGGGPGVLSEAQVLPFDRLPLRKMANGGESRDVIRGALATGEAVAVHESVLPVGSAPNPQHKIQHSEFIMVQEGTVEFEHGDKAEKIGPGSVVYVAFGTLHTLKNVGDVPAKYFVVAIGGDVKK
jgi:mannose-6-phosphate isomerase-like protein (cupin superfamily)